MLCIILYISSTHSHPTQRRVFNTTRSLDNELELAEASPTIALCSNLARPIRPTRSRGPARSRGHPLQAPSTSRAYLLTFATEGTSLPALLPLLRVRFKRFWTISERMVVTVPRLRQDIFPALLRQDLALVIS